MTATDLVIRNQLLAAARETEHAGQRLTDRLADATLDVPDGLARWMADRWVAALRRGVQTCPHPEEPMHHDLGQREARFACDRCTAARIRTGVAPGCDRCGTAARLVLAVLPTPALLGRVRGAGHLASIPPALVLAAACRTCWT
jgi:hypothetical protein